MKSFHIKDGHIAGVNASNYALEVTQIKARAKQHNQLWAGGVKLSQHEFSPFVGLIFQIGMDEFELVLLTQCSDLGIEYPFGKQYFDRLDEIESWIDTNNLFFQDRVPSLSEALSFAAAHNKQLFKDLVHAL